MTEKYIPDYLKIAQALRDAKPEKRTPYDERYHGALIAWNTCCENVAVTVTTGNFKHKFLQVCGYYD